jgi:hypothetical protein
MTVFVIAFELFWPQREIIVDDFTAVELPWRRWVSLSFATFVLILVGAALVNDEVTMTTANTRFPVWEWNDGPFPGDPVKKAEKEKRNRERLRRFLGESAN